LNVLDRARHAANPSAAVERVRQWRIDNPVRARELKRKSQATRRARLLEVFVEEVDPAVLWERDEGVCGICGDGCDHADYQIDHRVPLALGGEHSYANTQVAHPLCNLRKGSRGV
jgi:5-methylcytosine-specific restriction endonuclease McrA